jgi:hypothetical protein
MTWMRALAAPAHTKGGGLGVGAVPIAFESIEIDCLPGNPFGIPTREYSGLTVDLDDEPGRPTAPRSTASSLS